MNNQVQAMIIKKLVESQLRPDQVEWLRKNETLPHEVIVQFFLSVEGQKVLQTSVDSLMTEANKVFARAEELKKK